ncbi:MAG: GlxA family transcriptional regulator [Burkholderiales bacterium]|nr:GlxA family transcriptional regulator [Burkholderiales bacterium]
MRRRIVILAYEDMNLLDLSGPLQVFATANRMAASLGLPIPYETVVASAHGGLILTSAGLPIGTEPLSALDKLPVDTIVAAGGSTKETFPLTPALVEWIAARAGQVRRLCSVCTGTFLLAAAGQLHGRRAATHWAWVDRLRAQYPGLEVDADSLFVRDGHIWTSAGVTAGIDMSLALVEEDCGHTLAIRTARQLVMFIKRSGGQSQFSVPLAAQSSDKGDFAALHAWIAAHLHEPLPVERLAAHVGMSERTFTRHYTEKVGRTPAKTVEAIRLEAARRALETTNLPLKSIAAQVGYAEEQNLRRLFHRQLGVGPQAYRARFSQHAAIAVADPAAV